MIAPTREGSVRDVAVIRRTLNPAMPVKATSASQPRSAVSGRGTLLLDSRTQAKRSAEAAAYRTA